MHTKSPMEKRSRYTRTVCDKLAAVKYSEDHGVNAAATFYGCAPKSIRDWRAQKVELEAAAKKGKTRSLHHGRKVTSTYADIEDGLYEWIVDKISKGKGITTSVVISRIKEVKPILKEKTDNALRCFLRRFMKRRLLAYRKPTHVGQNLPEDFQQKMKEFSKMVHDMKAHHKVSDDRIINMDEVPIYYEAVSSRVISIKGAKTVTLTQTQAGQTRITMVLAVASDGSKLPPLLIFRGEFGKKLQKQLQKVPIVASKRVYAICDKTAWNNSEAMGYWVQTVWNSFNRNMKNNLLIMDDYSVHKTAEVMAKLATCRTYPCLIPGGMTRLLQPLDVGVNHIVKQELRNMFALDTVEREEKPTLDELRTNLIRWVDEIWNSPESKVTAEKIKNCFLKCGIRDPEEEKKEVGLIEEAEELKGESEERKDSSASLDPMDNLQDLFGSGGEEGDEEESADSDDDEEEKSKTESVKKSGESHGLLEPEDEAESVSESMSDIPSSETPPNFQPLLPYFESMSDQTLTLL
eukprot:TRINITY_DN2199_c0_g3_i1.p1 TRINITY_DN2199_c0_g3~~TRINITY_DN2199_c0_g3_i1.p1  ORF type:complete len:520 (-),score=38.77 TRINITY_DN2199_c0_g3_i1:178-1737(-)